MKSEAIAFGVAGIVFGLIAGWIIGSQQAATRQPVPSAAAAPAQSSSAAPAPVILDEAKVTAYRSVAEREPSNAAPRAELGKLYFEAERYDDAIKWYSEAAKLAPKDVNVSTDLGVALYYTNQVDKALAQFDQSLKLDPRNAKTLLHVGIVRAFAKQDLAGAQEAWQKVVELAPDSFEGQQAQRALESLRSAHPPGGSGAKPGA